jgi:hypothetical protein
MREAMRALGISRQTVLQSVKAVNSKLTAPDPVQVKKSNRLPGRSALDQQDAWCRPSCRAADLSIDSFTCAWRHSRSNSERVHLLAKT